MMQWTKRLKCKTEQTEPLFSLPRMNIRGGENVQYPPYLHPIIQLEGDRIYIIERQFENSCPL